MNLPQLRMESTNAQLGLNIRKASVDIQQPHARVTIKQVPASLEIKQPQGELTIDSSEARENLNIRGPLRSTMDNAEYSTQKLMEGISRISREGDQLRAIETRRNAIADIAFEKTITPDEVYYPSRTIGNGVKIHYEEKRPEINVKLGGAEIEVLPQRPIVNYTPGKVESYMKQWNSLKVEVIGLKLDRLM
ncbi:DUF6470 family protein [Brevibacillus sp. SIMBA_040]|uniref:DUF6470 family protein n=1 Tax=unclassified Brevibacillus TaxID=2684853 RepID=UPI00397BB800